MSGKIKPWKIRVIESTTHSEGKILVYFKHGDNQFVHPGSALRPERIAELIGQEVAVKTMNGAIVDIRRSAL